MSNEGAAPPVDLLDLTTEIIVKHVRNNEIASDQLPADHSGASRLRWPSAA